MKEAIKLDDIGFSDSVNNKIDKPPINIIATGIEKILSRWCMLYSFFARFDMKLIFCDD